MNTTTDLDMLAADLAKMLDRYGYTELSDLGEDDLLAALPSFLAAARDHAEQTPTGDAATWTPDLEEATEEGPQTHAGGRTPRMTYSAWWTTQRVELGATAVNEWYWRCPVCRTWAGPYAGSQEPKRVAMHHRHVEHDVTKGAH